MSALVLVDVELIDRIILRTSCCISSPDGLHPPQVNTRDSIVDIVEAFSEAHLDIVRDPLHT